MLYNIRVFQPDRKMKGHYNDSVRKERYALFDSDVLKSIRVLCFASSAWIVFIKPFQLECGNSGSWPLITHPAARSVAQSEEWLVMSQSGGELSDGRNVLVFSQLFLSVSCLLMVSLRQREKLRGYRCNRCRDMATLRFFEIAAAVLDFKNFIF